MMLPVRGKTLVFKPAKMATAFDALPNASAEQCKELARAKLKEAIDRTRAILGDRVRVGPQVGAHLEVLLHGHVREHAPAFRAMRDPAAQDLLRGQALDLLPVEDDAAGGGPHAWRFAIAADQPTVLFVDELPVNRTKDRFEDDADGKGQGFEVGSDTCLLEGVETVDRKRPALRLQGVA